MKAAPSLRVGQPSNISALHRGWQSSFAGWPFHALTTLIVGETLSILHLTQSPPDQPALTAPCQRNYPGVRDSGGTGTTAMIARGGQLQLEELAQRSFQLITRMVLILPRRRKRSPGDLKEMEFLTLAI